MALIHLTCGNFEAEVIKSKIPVIVDFWANWCPPCRMMSPIFEELSGDKSYAGKLKFAKLDTEEAPEIAGKYEIMSIPSFVLFMDGAEKARIVGAMPKEDFKKQIDKALKK
ncbi:MAG: thioredoxin [Nanoarchaeota archaeon]|nr:thioredoxin [Nanoarchaeota archaeon]MBU4299804.1 thioredoxin [Nanoarchaeota archaeon]MBU4452210.1 thioredoxin [Nanoarchaeota archaeon]MCG2723596.1 thioredoxin [archaeon]